MRRLALVALLVLLCPACGATIDGYTMRRSHPDETKRIAEMLDPLLSALKYPSLQAIAASKDCKIGLAVVRTSKINVWSAPPTTSPCVYFTISLTEGALTLPREHLVATLAHEFGHLVLHHQPHSDRARGDLSNEEWQELQAQEREADQFAVALLKRTQGRGACAALAQFLRRSVEDWYGPAISPQMQQAITQRVELADAACASDDDSPPSPRATAQGAAAGGGE